MADPPVTVRVIDARLVAAGGLARLVVSGLARADHIARVLVQADLPATVTEGRIEVTASPWQLAAAVAQFDGEEVGDTVAAAVQRAIAAWSAPPPDVATAGGVLPTGTRPVVMGVLNLTPDSFSDGGRFADPGEAVAAGRAMLASGAQVIDVGGESTRPGADPVPAEEELARVLPVVEALAADGAIVSIDTVKAAVARAAVAAGAAIVNDISAGSLDPDLLPTVAELQVPYVLTHLQGEPRTMQAAPHYLDVVAEVYDHLAVGLAQLEGLGLATERVIIDPGIGFGKRIEHNLQLLAHLEQFTGLGRPVLVGVSRKSFIGRLTGVPDAADRLAGSLAAASVAVANGARIVRVHDVRDTVQALNVAHAITTGSADPRGS